MNNFQEMEVARTQIEVDIKNTEKKIKHLPRGHLQCFRNGDNYKWFILTTADKKIKRKYIPRSDEEKAESLALKSYLEAELRAHREELKAINMYLRHCNRKDYAENYLAASSEHRRLVNAARTRILAGKDEELQRWLSDPNPSIAPKQDQRTLMSQAGFKVRSKSEQIIVALLMRHDIAFQYEQRLYVSGKAIYPDFMIMHSTSHKVYIWEHLGMMDNEGYRKHNLWKLDEYAKIGFIPGDNLILTYETGTSGCDEVLADYLIRHYLT